jgi:hypothetical protein
MKKTKAGIAANYATKKYIFQTLTARITGDMSGIVPIADLLRGKQSPHLI